MRQQYGLPDLGVADGPIKSAIFGGNNARLYKFTLGQRAAIENDRFAQIKQTYDRNGGDHSNLFYGCVHKPTA